ncbi:MAG: hypothetical protein IPK75_17840 [Acidobacteria bacterium]|nr:hypothetical protein [Acidobacteriota bacterium]
MPRYAIILNGTVENIIVADDAPTMPRRTVVALGVGQAVSPGDSYNGSIFSPRVLDANELERREAPDVLRKALVTLAAWQDDALSAAELGALTAAQRIARQAQSEQRIALLARAVRRMLILQEAA